MAILIGMDSELQRLPEIQNDGHWRTWRERWPIRPDTIYLNHGSFGPTPREVQACQRSWQEQIAHQPMDFFVRRFEPAWLSARDRVAQFVGSSADDLVLVENSTAAMNTVARSFPLTSGDEVVLTDHEYDAVLRIWKDACRFSGATEPIIARLPAFIESSKQIVDAILGAVTDRTRLLIVSHVTSPTAIIMPVKEICDAARKRGIAVCVDGPHAPAQIPLSIDNLDCDFYTASLHKWVSAPMGSGFLFVARRWQEYIKTPLLSWGRVSPRKPTAWWDEFVWPGTRDPSAYLACCAAIDVLESVGIHVFRARCHHLAQYARRRLTEWTGLTPPIPDSDTWYGCMASAPLPPGITDLQQRLWTNHGIEVPIIERNGQRSIRVSCHLYNTRDDIDSLLRALEVEFRRER